MRVIQKLKDESSVITEICRIIETNADSAIDARGRFIMGLSGGSLINQLSSGLPTIKTDWSKWILLFCDERIVPTDSLDSTFGCYAANLLGKVPLKQEQFIRINDQLDPEACAEDYTNKMKEIFKGESLPTFDVLLLGMGPDGHTCSLFPGHEVLNETDKWVAAIYDSPKPPPQRITLTLPVINNARCCVFAMVGEGKADIIKRILLDKEDLPAKLVQPIKGSLYWLLDPLAAKHIE